MAGEREPVGAELAKKNRHVIAERMDWPERAVEVCERIEDESPGWYVNWCAGGGMTWERPGFYAGRVGWHRKDPGPRYVFGATADELREAIADQEPVERWMDTR